jgi:hypothetical protein
MGFDDRAADREAHAHAVGLRRLEGFKQTRQALRAQPVAGIPHCDAHALRLDTHGADVYFAVAVLNATHRLDGIDDQVQHHLLKSHPIALDARQLARQLRTHRDAGLDRLAAGQGGHLQDRRIEVDNLLPGWRFFDERPDPVDDVAGSTVFVHNAGERLPHLRHIGRAFV